MANIKKSFNFRNGVQVDEDNLLVTPTGLVAIGKTIPTEALDVIGNVVISGVTSSVFSQTGILTVTTLEPTEIIGAGVSVVSGVVTSNSGSGIVTYYGDARFLQGMPTSQWQDTNAGFGVSSIYNTGGTVGIATTNPQFTLQVGQNPNEELPGVGIASAGNVTASGTITATSFVGNVTGNITGNVTGDVTGNSTGNLTGLVNSSGISTFGGINATGSIVGAVTSNVIPFFYSNLSDLPSAVTYHGAFAHVHATGKGYYAHGGNWIELVNKDTSGNVSLSGDLDVDGHTNLDNVSVSGVSTFNGSIITNNNFNASGDLDVDGHTNLDNVNIAGVTTFSGAINADGGASIDNIQIGVTGDNEIDTSTGNLTIDSSGGTTTIDDNLTISGETNAVNVVASGVITATTELNSPLIGVGTDTPANDIQVRKSGNAEIQITSDTGVAGLTVGREPSTANTNNAELRYGGGSGAPYSTAQSLDIINYGTDNFNYHLSANNPGAVVGDFHWHKGLNSGRLMTLTNTGRLGIGETQPNETLHVAGVSSVTGNSFVGGNFSVSGNSTVGGNLTVDGSLNISNINTDITGNVTGNLSGNVNSTSGISTFLKVGINTTLPLPTANLDVSNGNAVFKNVGIGSTDPDGILDVSGALSQASKKFILLPKVSAAGTSVLQSDSAEGGALIYNTTLRKLQFYNGDAWETVTSQII